MWSRPVRMTLFFVFVMLVFLMLAQSAAPVEEQKAKAVNPQISASNGRCGATEQVPKVLFREYRETPRGMGTVKMADGAPPMLVTLFYSENRSWTLILSGPDGVSCFMAWGKNWVLPDSPEGSA